MPNDVLSILLIAAWLTFLVWKAFALILSALDLAGDSFGEDGDDGP